MSAVYTRTAFSGIYLAEIQKVVEYVTQKPGKDIMAIATALGIPYEVVYECCRVAGMVILPNASGELQFGTQHGHGRP